MATVTKEVIKVKAVSRAGVLVGDKWYNFDKSSGLTSSKFQKGNTYEVEVNEGDNGTKFIKSMVAVESTTSRPVESTDTGTKETPMTRKDWDSKDNRISRAGIWQASVQAVATLDHSDRSGSFEDFIKNVETVANAGLEFINRK